MLIFYEPHLVPTAEEPTNPVVPFRYGRDVLESAPAFVAPRFLPFPYFQQEAPASPLIAYRYGQDVLSDVPAFVAAHFLAFPVFQEAPSSPVIGFRYGQPLLEGDAPFILPRYAPFPYFQAEAAANPVIAYLRGQWLGDAVPFPESVLARYFPFPYFEQPPAAPANPVIPFLMRRLTELQDFQRHPVPQYYGYVESNEEITPIAAARYIPQWRRRRR